MIWRRLVVAACGLAAGSAAAAPPAAGVTAPPGFAVTRFAGPPDVSYPTCLAAAPDGPVFVGVDLAGSVGRKRDQGKVVRCVDRDGDGVADTFTTFCQVESPRGLWWDGDKTLYVLHPPTLTAYHDDNGDGVADRSEDLVTGLGFDLKARGADHTTNGFRYAIDGFFYIAVGDYGFVKAVGKDGRTSKLRGGGVVRVRPDGTGLEVVADGLRNIYDVAVSPTLDLFTRDNTNDGGGWDVRLSHVVPTGHYGYPSLFVNFPEDIIQPLADYGGGSPCGVLFLDEPDWAGTTGSGLLTAEWGQGAIFRHPLSPNGATWKAGSERWLLFPRPTDLDIDGSGHLYISSWKDGGFDYSGPDVGFVARVTPTGLKPEPFPNLKAATDEELVTHLGSASQVRRTYAQRELLRRGPNRQTVERLRQFVGAGGSIAPRVAAVFTLGQLVGGRGYRDRVGIGNNPELHEYALRAVIDGTPTADPELVETLRAYGRFDSPRVRLQAAVGLGRFADAGQADDLLRLATDVDPVVAHVAVNGLVNRRLADGCLRALRAEQTIRETEAASRALRRMHSPAVVDELIAILREPKAHTSGFRRELLVTLFRLYNREADWNGEWWHTRPDTTGPYYKPVTWAESPKIAAVIKDAVAKADAAEMRWLVPELIRHRIDLPEVTAAILSAAATDQAVRRTVVAAMAARPKPGAEFRPAFAAAAADPAEAPKVRATAVRGLLKLSAREPAAVAVLAAPGPLPGELEGVYTEFARDGQRVREVPAFVALAADPDAGKRELAFAVLAGIADRPLGDPKARAAADAAVSAAWADPARLPGLLRAVARMGLTSYLPQIRRLADGPDPVAAAAAKRAVAAFGPAAAASSGPLVSQLPFEAVVAAVGTTKGNADLGAKLFQRVGCANCHTISASEPLKGPLLAGIAARYTRADLVESVLRPSAKIAQGFETWTFALADGKAVTGFIVRESGTEVEVRDGTGATAVLRKADLDDRKPGKVSVMPEKLADGLTTGELASILAYLESLKGK